MRTTNTMAASIAAAFLALGTWTCEVGAGIVISDIFLTENSVSFGISGNLPGPLPDLDRHALFFVNPDINADPGFALGNFIVASSYSFTGTPPLRDINGVATGFAADEGDYFFVAFNEPLAVGNEVSGFLTATWNVTAFDPSQVTSLDVYWGWNGGPINTGTYLTSVSVVPEPSAMTLVAFCVLGCASIRRRRNGHKWTCI